MQCTECGEKRVVYSAVKTNKTEKIAVERQQVTLFYVCGSILYPEGKYKDKLICRKGNNMPDANRITVLCWYKKSFIKWP